MTFGHQQKYLESLAVAIGLYSSGGICDPQKQSLTYTYVHTCAYYVLCLLFIIAAQLWLLGRVSPYSFGEDVPEGDENWNNYLQLLEIVDIFMASEISEDEFAELSLLIQQHHFVFQELYTVSCVLPKHYFMIHMLRLILKLVIFHVF